LPVLAEGENDDQRGDCVLGIAIAGTSLISYALMTRAERIKCNRWSAGDTSNDGGSTSGSEGWAVASWFGGDHSVTDSSAIGATSAAAIAGEAATAAAMEVVAIDATGLPQKIGILFYRNGCF
jgi:hypothetical protein